MTTRVPLVGRPAILCLWGVLALQIGCSSGLGGRASSYVIVQSLEGASGARPDEFGGTLASDVVTLVNANVGGETVRVPTIFEDPGRVVFSLGMKDPASLGPAPANFVTFTRYRVTYVRSDGRNSPGHDVPYPFDGALTVTVTDQSVSAAMTLVRVQAKEEPPLRQLVAGGGARAVSTLAEVTFYGRDQTGREVTATGAIAIHFADWGDPS